MKSIDEIKEYRNKLIFNGYPIDNTTKTLDKIITLNWVLGYKWNNFKQYYDDAIEECKE